MAQVIPFEEKAVARLRERLGAAVEANEDLIAFARGHSGAVESINAAVLAMIETASVEQLLDVVTRVWPEILGIDFIAIALRIGGRGFRADPAGIECVEPAFVDRMAVPVGPVEVRSVERGHPLFGLAASPLVRAQALIAIEGAEPFPTGLLALGQREPLTVEIVHGSGLLRYLGQVVAATIRRCIAAA